MAARRVITIAMAVALVVGAVGVAADTAGAARPDRVRTPTLYPLHATGARPPRSWIRRTVR